MCMRTVCHYQHSFSAAANFWHSYVQLVVTSSNSPWLDGCQPQAGMVDMLYSLFTYLGILNTCITSHGRGGSMAKKKTFWSSPCAELSTKILSHGTELKWSASWLCLHLCYSFGTRPRQTRWQRETETEIVLLNDIDNSKDYIKLRVN